MWIAGDQATEFLEQPPAKTLAPGRGNHAQHTQIPMMFIGVILTQLARNSAPALHGSTALTQQTPDLPTQTGAWDGKFTRRHRDEAADDRLFVANHAHHGSTHRVEYERAQTGPIRAHTSPRARAVNGHIHGIVTKREGKNIEQHTPRPRIRVFDRFVYHRIACYRHRLFGACLSGEIPVQIDPGPPAPRLEQPKRDADTNRERTSFQPHPKAMETFD